MQRGILTLGMAVLMGASAWAAAPPVKYRNLTAQEEKEAAALAAARDAHAEAGEFERAAEAASKIATYRRQRQGALHWQAVNARHDVERYRILAAVPVGDREELVRGRKLNVEGVALVRRGRFREAEQKFRLALLIHEQKLGQKHPETVLVSNNVAFSLNEQGKATEALPLFRKVLATYQELHGEEHRSTANGYNNVATSLLARGKKADALAVFRKALPIFRKALGVNHPDTASCYSNVASCLDELGRHAEALPLHQEALAAHKKVLGEEHATTALGYNNLASCLRDLGRFEEAMPLYQRALEVWQKVHEGDHPHVAGGYAGVAACLNDQGKRAAAIPWFHKALAAYRKSLGEDHPYTAASCNNLAVALQAQGKAAEALPLLERALATRRKVQGEGHPDTATTYNNLASCLKDLGKAAQALPLYEKALEIRKGALGEGHPDTAHGYNNVAGCLLELGKADQALPLYEKAVAVMQKALGEGHPDTAFGWNNLAFCLDHLGKRSEALPVYQRALRILANARGPDHPHTATAWNNVAVCLWLSGRRPEAVRGWQASLPGQEAARFHSAASGFERAQAGARRGSSHAPLAIGLAALGQPGNAFRHAELSLARGLLDDLALGTKAEIARIGHVQRRLAAIDAALVGSASRRATGEEQSWRETLLKERRRLTSAMVRLATDSSERQVLPLERIQAAIPADAALVLWVDVNALDECWGCVVRREGPPAWQRIAGSGKAGTWTPLDTRRQTALYQMLRDPLTGAEDRNKLLAAFAKQRLGPLRQHLKAAGDLPEVKRLFVVPTGPMAYVPAELLDEKLSVSYVPSGSMLARSAQAHRPLDASSLLALGDPAFDRAPAPEPPARGVLLKSVLAGGHAAKAGLQPGDVLLSIGGTAIGSFEDLQAALSELPAKAAYWRDGKTYSIRQIAGNPLGAVFDPRSARAAVRAWRRDGETLASRGTGHKRLPGTRLEAEAIASLVKGSSLLLGSAASEQRLDQLRAKGELRKYRVLHLATHGEADERMPGNSALILAQDRLPDPLAQASQQRHVYDGRLTVARIRNEWELDCDLVVLSACETALGKAAGGDGLLGFAQALLQKGARSVVLSRWKVDDGATALLMVRFYENLLAKREGLKKGMGRSAALDEAKRWLRSLPRQEAERLATLHAGGILRGTEGKRKAPSTRPVELLGDRPYAHPYYWAAFTLIGDPD